YVEIPADPGFQLGCGTVELSFTPGSVHTGAVLSRDSSDYDDGGHFTIWVKSDGKVQIRHQDTSSDHYFETSTGFYDAGDELRVTYRWDADNIGSVEIDNLSQATSYSAPVPAGLSWDQGATSEPITLGASQMFSSDNTADNLGDYFEGEISYVSLSDSPVDPIYGTSGSDTLTGTVYSEEFIGNGGNDRILGEGGDDTITAGGGRDTIYGGAGDDSIEAGSSTDYIYDGTGDDVIDAGSGNDHIYAGAGADTIIGGSGRDWLRFNQAEADSLGAVTVDLTAGTGLGGAAEGDVISGIEYVFGTSHSDSLSGSSSSNRLYGGGGDDTIYGQGGNDYIRGGAGADYLDGGSGSNYLLYDQSPDNITVNLTDHTVTGGEATGDTIIGFRHVVTGTGDDQIIGSSQGNSLQSGDGDDILSGMGGSDWLRGGLGADTIDGGTGTDWLDYWSDTIGVTVNLADETVAGGEAQGDVISNMENVRGGSGDDSLIGSASGEALRSEAGDDTILAGAGDDTVRGGTGADSLDGGDGTADFLDYYGGGGAITLDLNTGLGFGGEAEGDTVTGFESVRGSSSGDSLTASGTGVTIDGYRGDDTLVAASSGIGGDVLRGGNDEDVLELHDGFVSTSFDGGEGGTDWDVIDATGLSDGVIVNFSGE
ncbi:MAG: calcium-binding protein, partial [Mangrovicoccus sp.]